MANEKKLGIIVEGDISDVEKQFEKLITLFNKLVDKTINLVFKADLQALEALEADLKKIESLDPTINVRTNTGKADAELQQVTTEVKTLDSYDPTITIRADGSQAKGEAGIVKKEIESIDDETITIKADGSQAEGEINNLRSMLDELQQTVIDFAGGATVLAGMEGLAEEDNALSNMSKSSKELSGEMKKVADQVYKTTDADWATISETVQYVVGQMGLSGEAAVKMARDMINFQKAYPWNNMYELARAVSSLMKNMGVSANEAFNLIANAMAKTQDPGQDLLDTFWEYSNQFARMGWSAQEFSNYLITGLQNGAFNADKLGDAFKEMTIRITENRAGFIEIAKQMGFTEAQANELADSIEAGGPAAKDAVDQINNQFMGLPQRLQDQLGPKIYGTMYEDLRSTLPNSINTALSETPAQVSAEAQTAGKNISDDVNQSFTEWLIIGLRSIGLGPIIDGLYGMFGDVINIVMALVIGNLITSSLPKLGTWGTSIRGFFSNLGGRVSSTIKSWFGWGDDAGRAANNVNMRIAGEVDNPTVLGRIRNFGSNIVSHIKGWAGWGDEAGRATINLTKNVEGAFEMKPPLISRISQFGSDVVGFLSRSFPALKVPSFEGGLTGLLSKLPVEGIVKAGGKIAGALALITMGIDALWNASDYFSGGIVSGLLKITGIEALLQFVGLGEGVKNFEAWADGITGTVEGLFNTIFGPGFTGMFATFASDIQDTFRSSIDLTSIEGFFSSAADFIAAPFRDLFNEGPIQWIERILGTVYNLLSPVGEMVKQRLGGFYSWIVDAFTIDWGAIGYNMGQGVGTLITLILKGIFYLLQTLINLPGQVYNAILSLGTYLYNGLIAIPGMIQGAVTGLSVPFWNFINYLTSLPGRAYNWLFGMGTSMTSAVTGIPARVGVGLKTTENQFWGFINYLASLPGQAYKWVIGLGQSIYTGLTGIPGKVYNALLNIWKQFLGFIDWIKGLPTQLYNAIVNALNGFVKGLSDSFPQITYWLDKIRGLFPHSPPKWGPLVDIYSWGGNIAEAVSYGINTGFPGVVDSLTKKMSGLQTLADVDLNSNLSIGDLALPKGTLQTMSAALENNQNNKFEISVKLPENVSSTKEAKALGYSVGEGIVETVSKKLSGQMTTAGISTIRSIR